MIATLPRRGRAFRMTPDDKRNRGNTRIVYAINNHTSAYISYAKNNDRIGDLQRAAIAIRATLLCVKEFTRFGYTPRPT